MNNLIKYFFGLMKDQTKNKDNDVDENIVHQIESNSILRKLRIEKLNQNKIDNAPA